MPNNRKSRVRDTRPFCSPVLTQRGELVAKQERRTVKATFVLDVELVTRINAVASLRGQSRDALATAAFEEAVKGLVMFDRGRKSHRSVGSDRPVPEDSISSDGEQTESSGQGLTVVPSARPMMPKRAAG
jgi:hypothetical protein